jgi:hypothetical protein
MWVFASEPCGIVEEVICGDWAVVGVGMVGTARVSC